MASIPQLLKKLLISGSIHGYELRLKKRDGTIIWTTVSATLMRNADGRVIGVAGSLRDISDQKKVEQKLRESEEKLFDMILFTKIHDKRRERL